MSQFTGIAGEIEAAIGLELTVTLLRRRGGTEILIPVRPAGSDLASIIGQDAAAALTKAMGAGRINLPMAGLRGAEQVRLERREKAVAMLQGGASIAEVAMRCGLHQRTVSKYRADMDTRQRELPF